MAVICISSNIPPYCPTYTKNNPFIVVVSCWYTCDLRLPTFSPPCCWWIVWTVTFLAIAGVVPLHQKVEGLLHITSCTQQKQLQHPGGFKPVQIFVSVFNVTGLVNCTLYGLELQKCWFYGLNSKS